MHFIYILKSFKDKKKYIGCTNNIQKRLKQHNLKKCLATRNRTPFELTYFEEYENPKEAYYRESFFKTGKGREYIKNILNL